jgi:type IV secretion system protein VirB10
MQEPTPATQSPAAAQAQESAGTAQTQTTPAADRKAPITIPVGTRVSLTLVNPIKANAAHVGDSVRAVTAFPVAADGQVAIPAGVFVEGVIDKVNKKDPSGHPTVQFHFTRILFPNGSALPLDAASTEARAEIPSDSFGEAAPVRENGPSAAGAFEFQQQPPPLPPLPKPNYAPFIGAAVGGVAVAVIAGVLGSRHRNAGYVYDVGWQFEMVLESPLTVDATNWNADVGH